MTLSSSSTAYSPGPISKPGDVTALGWNCQKEFILASALSTGHTIIWDLRTKSQIKTLTYAAPGLGGGGPGGNGGRGAVSSVCWHPEDVRPLCREDAFVDPRRS
jgi:WD40 repeat protein